MVKTVCHKLYAEGDQKAFLLLTHKNSGSGSRNYYTHFIEKKKKQANKLRPQKKKLPANVHRNHSFAHLTNSKPCTMLGMEEKQIS